MVVTENSSVCCLIQAYFTVAPWQSTLLPFLTGPAPLSAGRFLFSIALILRKDDHQFALLFLLIALQ
jgi:hypothetical protein